MSGLEFGGLSGRSRLLDRPRPAGAPLVIAIHGGTYTSAYFDVTGYSLLDRAAANEIPIIAVDRPGYADSPDLPPAEGTIRGAAGHITRALHQIWSDHGKGAPGIFLIGHSIGFDECRFCVRDLFVPAAAGPGGLWRRSTHARRPPPALGSPTGHPEGGDADAGEGPADVRPSR